MDYAMGRMCARCRIKVDPDRDCLGESGIFSPSRSFTLCEPCFEEEDAECNGDRGNDLPERLEMYRQNLRAGPLHFRAPVPPLVAALSPPLARGEAQTVSDDRDLPQSLAAIFSAATKPLKSL